LVSKNPGIVPRQDGKHSLHRITGETLYHDNYAGYTYTHLQTSLDTDQTIALKTEFEAKAATHAVEIKKYHSDNRKLAEKGFKDTGIVSNTTIK